MSFPAHSAASKHNKLFSLSLLGLAVTAAMPVYAETNKEDELEKISVVGRAAKFYFFEESSMATKTPTDFMDIAQSMQVLSNELIRDQAAWQTTELYRSISGVSQFSYSGVTARGFRQDQVRYDGVQGDPYSGFSIPQLFNVERVEVLKGPSGMLYGSGEPGALLNYVSKKPKFENNTEVSLFGGNYSVRGLSVDSTGALADSDDMAYRIAGFYHDKKPFRNNTNEENLLISGGLTWNISEQTEVIFQYDFIDQDLAGHRIRGIPVDDNGNFLTDISFNTNEASDFQRVEADVLQTIINHEFSDNLSNRTVVRHLDNRRTQNYHENRGLAEDGRSVVREFRDQLRENQEISFTTDFVYETELGGLEHTILFGGEYLDVETHFSSQVGRGAPSNIPNIDLFSPVYGADPSTYTLIDRPTVNTEVSRIGFYVQDQLRLNEQWLAVIGARYDRFEDELLTSNYRVDDNAITPRVGVIYQPDNNTSIFVNVSEGFSPQTTNNQLQADGDTDSIGQLQPEESRQIELGIKNYWFDNRISTALTFYDITKDNVTVGNPLDTGEGDGQPSRVQIGEVTSRGIELDVVGDFAENWTGTLSYAYNDAEISGGNPDSIRNSVGTEFANAPDHTLGAWTRFDFPAIDSSFAFGVDYVSDRVSLSGQTVKSYAIWDASWQTEINGFLLQANIRNLFDKEYATSGFIERTGHFPGEPRTLLLQVTKNL